MSEFHFLRPLWLLALPPALLLAWWSLRGAARQAGAWAALIEPALLPALLRPPPSSGTRAPLALLAAGWSLAVIALAGPAWERLPEPVHARNDALVIALDLSLSMQATDLAPSRLERARFKLRDLLAARREGHTALVAWAGDAHVVTPLSDDTGTITALLDALEPSIMPEPGSDPVAAVRLAGELLQGAGLRSGRVLLVCDAFTATQAKQVAVLLERFGLELSVLAVGTAAGAPVPLPGGGLARERDGSIVVPALDAAGMREATAIAGGRFAELRLDEADLRTLLPQRLSGAVPSTRAVSRVYDQWLDRAPWLACLLLPLAAAAFRRGWLLALPLALLLAPREALAFEWRDLWLTRDQQGARALAEGDAARAAERFRSPGWRGTAAYGNGDFEGAAEAFGAMPGADGHYNRGNALARAGRLAEALAAYDAALAAAPGMPDAAHNRRLVEDALARQQAGKPGSDEPQQGQDAARPGAGADASRQPPQDAGPDGAARDESGAGGQPGDEQTGRGAQDRDAFDDDERQAQDGHSGGTPPQEATPRADAGPQSADERPAGEPAAGSAALAGDGPGADAERAQALEQWLRQVPDEPGELLRRKFEYESRARRAAGDR